MMVVLKLVQQNSSRVLDKLWSPLYTTHSSDLHAVGKKKNKNKMRGLTEYMMLFHPLMALGVDGGHSRTSSVQTRFRRIGAALRILCLAELEEWSEGVSYPVSWVCVPQVLVLSSYWCIASCMDDLITTYRTAGWRAAKHSSSRLGLHAHRIRVEVA
jgi:hypothetical protein